MENPKPLTDEKHVHIGILPPEQLDEEKCEDDAETGADPEDELAGEIPELWQEGVEQEGGDETHHADREADRVSVMVDDRLKSALTDERDE